MLRIRFRREDLARVWFMISPMAETILSVVAMQRPGTQLPFARWRDEQRHRLAAAPSSALLKLVPLDWRPEVALAPIVGERPRFDEELDAVLDFSSRPVRAYLATLNSPAHAARWTPVLAEVDGAERRFLGDLLSDYHSRCIDEYWPAIRARLEADIAHRSELRAAKGTALVLARLHPEIHWCDPVLEVGVPGSSRHLDLGGRGLVLVPSAFAWPDPIALLDATGQPVLLYPARDLHALWSAPAYDHDILGTLLGPTRAAVLVATTRGESTGRLADRLDVSLASVSYHLTALRNAGLVYSTRRARSVHHDLTPLGVRVLLTSQRFEQA
jgi:DNA-binding MarR family transcriptional regulator